MSAIVVDTSTRVSGRVLPPKGTLFLSGLWMLVWIVGAFITQSDHTAALVLAGSQGLLAIVTLELFRVALPSAASRAGLYVLPVLLLHVALYYGVFNVVPALLIEWRSTQELLEGVISVPEAPISAYVIATWAALAFVVGVTVGCRLAYRLIRQRPKGPVAPSRDGRFHWLPGYRTSLATALGLAGVVLITTIRYGTQYYQIFTDEDQLAALPFWEQLLFHGIIPFLPLPAVLAAAAILVARTSRQRRWGVALFIVIAVFNVGALSIWGMRSGAILVFLMPMALFVYTGRIRWQKMLVPAVAIGALVYVAVTVARLSALGEQLGQGASLSPANAGQLLEAGADQDVLVEKFVSDMSYRTSGLEPVAGIIRGQDSGVLSLMGGRVLLAGFIQALPAVLRPGPDVQDRIKTAPSHYGWFTPGDYVTTILSELVMDAGPWLVVVPAIAAGLLLVLFDQTLLTLGQRPFLEPILVVRLAWLVTVLNATSLSDLTLLFLKATIGYSVFFVLIGALASSVGKFLTVRTAR